VSFKIIPQFARLLRRPAICGTPRNDSIKVSLRGLTLSTRGKPADWRALKKTYFLSLRATPDLIGGAWQSITICHCEGCPAICLTKAGFLLQNAGITMTNRKKSVISRYDTQIVEKKKMIKVCFLHYHHPVRILYFSAKK